MPILRQLRDKLMDISEQNHVIKAVLNGDVDAYGQLVRTYQKPIYNFMYRATCSEPLALEMTQETFTRAYEKLERFNPGSSFFSWLYAIGSNLAKDYLRKARREVLFCDREIDADNLVDENLDPAACLDRKIEIKMVMELMQKLPHDDREAIILRYRDELSMREIAQAFSISPDAAKMRVHRALKTLRVMIKNQIV